MMAVAEETAITTKKIRIALAGNPNTGKTSVFNQLTGARQHVGNYPGVTVEKKEGFLQFGDTEIQVTDLPGTYSLSADSIDERVVRDFITNEAPDVLVNVLDSTNLERNLYLTTQLLELGMPLVLAANMNDLARAHGIRLDSKELSHRLGVPVVPIVGRTGDGIEKLIEAAVGAAEMKSLSGVAQVEYGTDPEQVLSMAERRFQFISGACEKAVHVSSEERITVSDRIDSILTHKWLAIPIFMGLMYLVFHLTFTLGEPVMNWMESAMGWIGSSVAGIWSPESNSMLRSLLVDGIIGGVGGVLVFLPNILLLFLAISILEATGYMARAAFIMDRLMSRMGLHGKSFIPLLLGFGCSVPAIMATRTLESRRDRLTTMLVTPLMSCGARLPIYTLIIPAFFTKSWQAPILWIIYVIGIALAVLSARLLRSTLFRGISSPFLLELPPYRVPTFRTVMIQMCERGWLYLRKAGTIILGISIVLWAMTSYPRLEESDIAVGHTLTTTSEEQRQASALEHTFAGRAGHLMEPILGPMGFDWKIGTALLGAFAAKEAFVAQLGIVHSLGETDEESDFLRSRLRASYSPLVAFCIMLFCLISVPCMATLAVMKRESGSWKWPAFQVAGLTILAWLLTTLVYQSGSLLGIGV